ncbi:MAG: ATP-binding protein [Gammaproteobacteria bacterium]|nr:ATP-binding protein [Gammaproteobacteria bacterium]
MKIFPKLFLASSMSFLVVIGLMLFVIQWRFEQDLTRYINNIETNQLEVFASELEEYYAEVQTWDFLESNPRIAELILRQSRSFDQNIIIVPRAMRERRRFRFSFDEPNDTRAMGRLILLNQEKEVIIGAKELPENLIQIPINFEEEVVGTLALLPSNKLFESIDLQFADAQRQALYLSGFVALLIAAIISLILTQNISGPIRKLARATRSLISGEFKTRVNITNKDELGKLSRDFNILAKTLDKEAESADKWLADISHELRTPLAILKSELEAIEDGIREFDEETLNSLTHEVKRINTLVNDLYELSLSDLGAMKYQMVETDIKTNIESSIESFRDRYREAEIDIKTNFDEVGNILGDQHRLTQLFTNLLENTLKYTDGPGSLNINMQGIDNEIIVSFADSAPGVDEETLDKIFDRFYRVELSRSREMGGAGLGLSICSEIVDAHSGSIKAKQSSIGGLEIVIIFNKAES